MNKLIQELANQAKIEDGCFVVTQKQLDYFSELIVRECVAQIEPMWKRVQEIGAPPGYDYGTFNLAYNDCMNAIKERFDLK